MDNPSSAVSNDQSVPMKLRGVQAAPRMAQRSTFENPSVVIAKTATQCGYEYLYGECPRCGQRINLSTEGKRICLHCGNWIELKQPAAAPVAAK